MKIINAIRLLIVLLLTIFVQPVHCANDMQKTTAIAHNDVDQQQELAKTFAETRIIIKNATEAMNNAYEHLLGPKNEDEKNVKTIIEQNTIAVLAQQKLEKLSEELGLNPTEGYLSKLVTGVKKIGATVLTRFGAGPTEENKIASGLIKQYEKIIHKYKALEKNLMSMEHIQPSFEYFLRIQAGLASAEQTQLYNRYNAIVEQWEDALFEQIGDTGFIATIEYIYNKIQLSDFNFKQTDLATAIDITESIAHKRTQAMDHTRELLLSKNTTKIQDRRNIIRIIDDVIVIVEAKAALNRLHETLVVEKVETKNDSQSSYFSQFVASLKNLENKLLNTYEGPYSHYNHYAYYERKAKESYPQIIEALNEQKSKITNNYGMRTPEEQVQLKNRYEAIIVLLNKNITDLQKLLFVPSRRRRVLSDLAHKGASIAASGALGWSLGGALGRSLAAKKASTIESTEEPANTTE